MLTTLDLWEGRGRMHDVFYIETIPRHLINNNRQRSPLTNSQKQRWASMLAKISNFKFQKRYDQEVNAYYLRPLGR
jgi:hypothetical protein